MLPAAAAVEGVAAHSWGEAAGSIGEVDEASGQGPEGEAWCHDSSDTAGAWSPSLDDWGFDAREGLVACAVTLDGQSVEVTQTTTLGAR